VPLLTPNSYIIFVITGKLSFSEYACSYSNDGSELSNPNNEAVVVCGSIGEVSNDLTFGTANGYDIKSETTKAVNNDIYLQGEFVQYKHTVWANLALYDEGQLRQRVAWALYQIIPIGKPLSSTTQTEIWLQY